MNTIAKKYNIAIFASGTGSNFINIYNNICNGNINAQIKLLISNNPNCRAIEFADKNKINYKIINNFRFKDNQIDNVMLGALSNYEIDLIVLAGYMKKISKKVIEFYNGKILNIHPALLPKFGGKGFYGMKIHESVIKSKEKITGVTVHVVDHDYDTGNIIYQKEISVLKSDTASSLSQRVLELEHRVYPEVIRNFLETI